MSSSKLFDPVRKKWVEATPEEKIRQACIRLMIDSLGYPLSLLAVEKELIKLPQAVPTFNSAIPKRRADIIAFAKGIKADCPLSPLLLIECKAVDLTPDFANQVISYNTFVKAPFITLANGNQCLTGWYDSEESFFRFEKGLPCYEKLIEWISSVKV